MYNEIPTIRHLINAIEHIEKARTATKQGFIDDFCVNSLRELDKALALAIKDHD